MNGELKISSIVIAKNEEQNIARCIESQLNCVDEIIVFVDETTTDKTLEIARNFAKVKAETVRWRGFAKTKQAAVKKACYDWIFWIDADEAVSEELCKSLNEFKNKKPVFDVYKIPRKANFLGKWIKHGGWYPAYVARLFNKNKVSFNLNEVHEGLDFTGRTGILNGDLLHFTDPNIFHYFEKFNRYTTLAANELAEKKGKKTSALDIFFRPSFLFFKMFILKAGILDGFHGFILAVFSSFYVFVKYLKVWEINNSNLSE